LVLGQVFSEYFGFPANLQSTDHSIITIIYHLGLVKEANRRRSSTWTVSPHYNINNSIQFNSLLFMCCVNSCKANNNNINLVSREELILHTGTQMCILVGVYRHCRRNCCVLCHENENSTYLRSIGKHLPGYMASHPMNFIVPAVRTTHTHSPIHQRNLAISRQS
jgi:hypothetical protein